MLTQEGEVSKGRLAGDSARPMALMGKSSMSVGELASVVLEGV
jgi:hypothetical protein